MGLPTVQLMVKRGFTLDEATKVRELMEKYQRRTSGLVVPEVTLGKISDVIGGCGMESIPAGHNTKSPAIHYVNMGDTYDTTVLWVNGKFRIGCWGDIVERGNYA